MKGESAWGSGQFSVCGQQRRGSGPVEQRLPTRGLQLQDVTILLQGRKASSGFDIFMVKRLMAEDAFLRSETQVALSCGQESSAAF